MMLSVPMENGLGKTKGTCLAPGAILAELRSLAERSVSESGALINVEAEELALDLSNIEDAQRLIEKGCAALLEGQKGLPIILGGDHSLTYAAVKAFRKRYPKGGLLVLDAHPDMMHAFHPPTHEDWLLTLLSDGILSAHEVCLFGLRSMHLDEAERLRKMRIKQFPMREISMDSLPEIIDAVMIACRQWEAVYLSVDIDVVDPAFAPGTGYPEPGGLTAREFLYALTRLRMLPTLRMADLVEVNPRIDPGGATVRLAAKALAELF